MAAVVQSLQHPSMTLGNEANKMQYKATNNCVIVTSNYNNQMQQKSVITTTAAKRPLAAATNVERTSVVVNNNSLNISNNDMLRCKRKINFHMPYGTPGAHHQPASVARRNARERNRVKQVNNGFATLRQHIPPSVAAALSSSSSSSSASNNGRGASKKLSKVETLRMAVEYIRSLQAMIQQHESEMSGSHSGMNTGEQNEYYEIASPQSSKNNILTTPPCSESSSSPTPSYSSESSLSTPAVAYTQLNVYHPESYENYEPMSPEDEELLDVISWWQQQ